MFKWEDLNAWNVIFQISLKSFIIYVNNTLLWNLIQTEIMAQILDLPVAGIFFSFILACMKT